MKFLYEIRNEANAPCTLTVTPLFSASTAVSPSLQSPIGCLLAHLYNGEPGESNRVVNYLAYPVLLTAVFLASKFLL